VEGGWVGEIFLILKMGIGLDTAQGQGSGTAWDVWVFYGRTWVAYTDTT